MTLDSTRETHFTLASVVKRYRSHGEPVAVFDGVDMKIDRADFVAVMGPSGSGKTTLLNLLAGVDRPSQGQVLFRDRRVDTMSRNELSRYRSQSIGFVFQSYNLLPTLSAARNVELPLMLNRLHAPERRRRVNAALSLVGLNTHGNHLPAELSGGQQQRVAIARAIVADTEALLCDEPTGNLDRRASDEIMGLLAKLNAEFGKTIVLVTHDPRAAGFARRCCCLDKGRFVDGQYDA